VESVRERILFRSLLINRKEVPPPFERALISGNCDSPYDFLGVKEIRATFFCLWRLLRRHWTFSSFFFPLILLGYTGEI